MSYDTAHLLSLVPAIYRLRDRVREEAPNGPLEALLEAIATQVQGVERNVDQLYDDLFIETCADWVVPYLGDLIGHTPLRGSSGFSSPRAEVANTIDYRRRKGTLRVLEMLAAGVTGWPAVAIECFRHLAQMQHLNHLRPDHASTASLREPLARLSADPIFRPLPHSVEIGRIENGRGIWNIPNVAIFLWRLRAIRVEDAEACRVDPAGNPERFTFHPLGLDIPLFQEARQLSADEARITRPDQIPRPASARLLHHELESRRALIASGAGPATVDDAAVAFRAALPVVRILIDGNAVPPELMQVCDLTTWTGPTIPGMQAAVDPLLGRFALPGDRGDVPVRVDYDFGMPDTIGAGSWDRNDPASPVGLGHGDDFETDVNAAAAAGDSDIRIIDSATLAGNIAVNLPAGRKLTVRAASARMPALSGTLTVDLGAGASLTLTGLMLGGGLTITGGLGAVTLRECTVPLVRWEATEGGTLTLNRCLSGPLELNDEVAVLITECVINAAGHSDPSIGGLLAGSGAGQLKLLSSSTVIGTIRVREIGLVENSICSGPVLSTRTQEGCVRWSYIPPGSVTPPDHQCQPAAAVKSAQASARAANSSITSAELAAIATRIRARIRPEWTSVVLGNPAFAQLGPRCAPEIRTGAEDGSEMGVYRRLEQPHREANLRDRLDEYLRLGLFAGIFHAN